MAFVQTIHCDICKQSKQVTVGAGQQIPKICHHCSESKKKQEEIINFARLDNMPTEDRLREMEIWIHEHKKQKHYSPPMRF